MTDDQKPLSQPDGGSFHTVVVALLANLTIAVIKLIAAFSTRSSAMQAEAFHAAADTGNQVLLLVADRRAGRPPDSDHPMGHGREAYFWALMASLGVFFAGSLLALRQGVHELRHPTPVESHLLAYVILAISFVLDGASLIRAYHQIKREADSLDREFLEHLGLSSDPVGRAVFAEDAVAVAGNIIAMIGIAWHQVTGSAIPDAIAALIISAGLGIVALDLARRNRDFLVGQEASPEVRARLKTLIARQPGITAVTELLVTFLGPRRMWVVARIDVDDTMNGATIKALLCDTERAVQAQSTAIARVDLVPRGRR